MADADGFEGSYEGIGEMLNSDWMIAEMVKRGEAVKERAKELAPEYEGTDKDEHRGRYKRSFFVHGYAHGGQNNDRAVAVIGNDSPEAIFVEKGVVRRRKDGTLSVQPGQHVLARALYETMGGKLPLASKADEAAGIITGLRKRTPKP